MQKALITGASSGIGKELALLMAHKGHDLILIARDANALNAVKQEIETTTSARVEIISVDLSAANSPEMIYQATKNKNVSILVNNAGVGLKGDFFHDDIDRTKNLAELNMISLMELCQLFGKDFVAKNEGRILNVGSIAAFLPGPKQPVYYATKAFVRSLGRALAYDLRSTNVTVTTLHPGVTKTDFFKASNAAYVTQGASARSVAHTGYRAMMTGKIEVTHGWRNKFFTNIFVRILPYRLQSYMVDRVSEI